MLREAVALQGPVEGDADFAFRNRTGRRGAMRTLDGGSRGGTTPLTVRRNLFGRTDEDCQLDRDLVDAELASLSCDFARRWSLAGVVTTECDAADETDECGQFLWEEDAHAPDVYARMVEQRRRTTRPELVQRRISGTAREFTFRVVGVALGKKGGGGLGPWYWDWRRSFQLRAGNVRDDIDTDALPVTATTSSGT